MARQFRVFGGKKYSLHGQDKNKREALKRAKKLRRSGGNARVVRTGERRHPTYNIYVR